MLNNQDPIRFPAGQRLTRRRSSAGPLPPMRPQRPRTPLNRGLRPTYLGLRDHGRVYVADLPRLSDGQLARLLQEAQEMHGSLSRRLAEPGHGDQTDAPQTDALQTSALQPPALQPPALDEDTRIRASTKLDVTERFLRAIAEEQEGRRSNPAVRAAADESLARTFLELARHRLARSSRTDDRAALAAPLRQGRMHHPKHRRAQASPRASRSASRARGERETRDTADRARPVREN